jgi:cell division protein FtsL
VLASQRRRSPLRVVTPRRPESPRRLPFLIACFVFVGSLVVAVVSVQALVAQSSFQMQQVTRRNAVLAQAAGRLQLEIAQLSAPSRMAKEARKLGLRLPGPGQLHTLVVRGRP